MEIKEVVNRIGKLQNKEKLHILNILKVNDVDFTKNTNGYFFNLANIDDNIMNKVVECLELIENNRNIMIEIDKRRNELISYYKKIIQERIDEKTKKYNDEYINRLMICKSESNMFINIKRKKVRTKYIEFDNSNVETNRDLKVDKNSTWYRILTRIKQYNQKHNGKDRLIKSQVNYDEIQDVYDIDVDGDIYEEDEVYEEDEIYAEYDDINDKISDIEDNNSNIDNENSCDMEDVENEEPDDDKTGFDIQYYKNLLNKQGFVFDNNKECKLTFQEYIKLEDIID